MDRRRKEGEKGETEVKNHLHSRQSLLLIKPP